MKNKNEKYESLFIFRDEEEFLPIVSADEELIAEHERMTRVSELIKEVAPEFRQKRRAKAKLKLACASFALVMCLSTLGVINLNPDIHDYIKYGQTLSIEDYGFPVDSYGLIMVN